MNSEKESKELNTAVVWQDSDTVRLFLKKGKVTFPFLFKPVSLMKRG